MFHCLSQAEVHILRDKFFCLSSEETLTQMLNVRGARDKTGGNKGSLQKMFICIFSYIFICIFNCICIRICISSENESVRC